MEFISDGSIPENIFPVEVISNPGVVTQVNITSQHKPFKWHQVEYAVGTAGIVIVIQFRANGVFNDVVIGIIGNSEINTFADIAADLKTGVQSIVIGKVKCIINK